MQKMARYYRLILDDYSAAAFTSFSKYYFGTLKQLKGLFDDIRSEENTAKSHASILSTFDRFLAGEKNIKHYAAYQGVPFLVPAKILGTETSVLTDYQWTHLNTWLWPYYMKCDKAESEHLWISCRGEYFRCIRTEFTNLQYGTDQENYEPLGMMIWGYPGQIQGKIGNLHNQLFVAEKQFKSKTEALNNRMNFIANPDPDFSKILEDVFGDG